MEDCSAVNIAKTAAMIAAAQFHETYGPGVTLVSEAGVKTVLVDKCDELRPFSCATHSGPQPPNRCAVCALETSMRADSTQAWFCELIKDASGVVTNLVIYQVLLEYCVAALCVARGQKGDPAALTQ